jgi:16S rRNA (guanine(966)-N(2))-methyltransferase RsmD
MRVIAGQYRSRLLKSLKGLALRPTSDRLRETLFNVLGPEIAGSHFLDIFAGTGAVGIEALSRGAAEAVFIENHSPAAALIRKNLDSLGIRSCATILANDALRGLQKLASGRKNAPGFTHVFLDPPYASANDYLRVLHCLASAEFLAPDAVIIAEHRHSFSLPERVSGFEGLYLQTLREEVAPANPESTRVSGFVLANPESARVSGFVLANPESALVGSLTRVRILKQGDAALSFYRRTPGVSS